MISVRNLPQLSSGNNIFWVALLLLWLSACSPQVIQRTSVKPGTRQKSQDTIAKQEKSGNVRTTVERNKMAAKKFDMTVLMPFKADKINIATASKSDIQGLDLAVDYYQGFLMGLKENINSNIQLNIEVLDSEDQITQLKKFETKGNLNKQLLIGPVYPDAIKYLSNYVKQNKVLMLSPLSAASPSVFQTPQLISVMPNIAIHVDKLMQEIKSDFKNSTNVNFVLIPSTLSESVNFAKEIKTYFKKYFPENSLVEFSNIQQISTIKSNGSPYCFIVSSASRAETVPVLNALGKFKDSNSGSLVKVYGHPNWAKQNYSLSILNKLNIHFTAASSHEMHNAASIQFENSYKKNYKLAPSEYAYNGYDVGVFVAKAINDNGGRDFESSLQKVKYKGLNTNFDFALHPQYGFINLGLKIIEFSNQKMIIK